MQVDSDPLWVSPLPPVPSGIAQYSRDFLDTVADTWKLELLSEPGSARYTGGRFATRSASEASANPRLILQIGNSAYHEHAFRLAVRPGGVLVLHDVVLHHARLADFVRRGRPRDYVRLMAALYGNNGRTAAEEILRGARQELTEFALSEDLVTAAEAVIVHSQHARDRVVELVPEARVMVVPMGVPMPTRIDRQLARQHLGLGDDAFIVSSITHINPMKRIPVVLRAFRRVVERVPNAMLVVAGSVAPGMHLERMVALLGLRNHVWLTGYLSDDDARILASASDASVNLRYPSTGETSASLLRLLGAGIPVIVTANGASLEIPEGSVLHLPVDRLEEETLAEYIVWLSQDDDARNEIGKSAREFLEQHHSMANAVEGYRNAVLEAWGYELPEIPCAARNEPAPDLVERAGTETPVLHALPVHHDVADALARLGLGKHDGTIVEIARSMSRLGLRAPKEGEGDMENHDRQVDPELLEILACPVCKVRVRLSESELICDTCGRHYRIENGIPIMLVDDSA